MSNVEKPHFSKRTLDMSERIQHGIGHSTLGSRVVRAFAGSSLLAYRQLDWFSQNVRSVSVEETVRVSGNPHAGRLARNWHVAMLMAASTAALAELHEEEAEETDRSEAVAYFQDGVVHVGVPQTPGALFGRLNDNERAIGMRLGHGPLEATMGLWLPNRRSFIGVEEDLRLVQEHVATGNFSPLSQTIPEIPLT